LLPTGNDLSNKDRTTLQKKITQPSGISNERVDFGSSLTQLLCETVLFIQARNRKFLIVEALRVQVLDACRLLNKAHRIPSHVLPSENVNPVFGELVFFKTNHLDEVCTQGLISARI